MIEPFGVSDALHEKLADLFARRFHRERSRARHHIVDEPNLFASLSQHVRDFLADRLIAGDDDGHRQLR